MKSLVIFGILISATLAQRPSFAGSSAKGYPELASRFRDAESTTDSTSSTSTSTSTIANRLGVDSSTTTVKIPVDARGDEELIKRLQDWPAANRPFWLINAEHIERHRNPQGSTNQVEQIRSRSGVGGGYSDGTRSPTPVPQRSSFLGSSSRQ